MKKLFFSMLALMLVTTTFAQIKTPSASPSAEVKQGVGLTDITINYSRPSAKGRTIFAADGLVPFGEVWRTGANSVTKITFGDDASIGGEMVKAGAYGLLTIPDAKEWTFMLYPYESSNWSSYVEKDAVAKFMAPVSMGPATETFTIAVNNLTDNSATIDFSWEKTLVSVPVKFEVHDKVMENIKRVMAGPSANDYYAAANYLHTSGADLNQALEYVQKATAGEKPAFWMVRREALILADLGRKQEAIKAAQRSLELAKAAGNNDYVRMNEKSIAEWSGK
ncbi:MAG: DUF2911 domain-containing protein [Saprospiraceae bacterium]